MKNQATSHAPQQTSTPSSVAGNILQRTCACGTHTIAGGECTSCQKEQSSATLQRAATSVEAGGEAPPIVYEVLRSPGQPLAPSTRAFMESRFGYDFSRVRVHTDAKAAESARAVNALAYTLGQDVVFGAGQYAPGVSTVQPLLAHELVHVMQQSSAASNSSGTLLLGDTSSAGELEAEQLSEQLLTAPVPDGQTSYSENSHTNDVYAPGKSVIQRQSQVPVAVPYVGLAVAAANFGMSLRPAGQGGLTETDVQFRYARATDGPHPIREARHTIFHMSSIKGLGASYGFWEIVLRYDGNNITSAYTQQKFIDGYDGGMLGSEATVNFSAIEASSPTEPTTQAYLLISGLNNPSGPGFQRFVGRILVKGNGEVIPDECQLTEGDGYARVNEVWCEVGWD